MEQLDAKLAELWKGVDAGESVPSENQDGGGDEGNDEDTVGESGEDFESPPIFDFDFDFVGPTTLPPFTEAKKKAKQYTSDLYYHFNDFLLDFGTSELFFVDGDSLVAYAFSDPNLSWKEGGQYLHFVYNVEKLLDNLLQLGARFRIYFFTCQAKLWHGTKLLARQLLIYHLLSNTSLRVDIFSGHINTVQWKEHLDYWAPAYVILKFVWKKLKDVDHAQMKIVYKALTLHYHGMLKSIVTLEDIQFKGNRAYSFVVEPPFRKKTQLNYRILFDYTFSLFAGIIDGANSSEDLQAFSKAIEAGFDGRNVLAIVGLCRLLTSSTMSPLFLDLAKMYCIYLTVLEKLPLTARSHNLPALVHENAFFSHVPLFLEALAEQIHPLLSTLITNHSHKKEVPPLNSAFCDLIDARGFLMFLLIFKSESTKGEKKAAEKMWDYVTSYCESTIPFSFPDPPISEKEKIIQEIGDSANENDTPKLCKVGGEFVETVIPDIIQRLARVETVGKYSGSSGFVDNYHWHTGRDFVDNDHLIKYEKPSKMKYIQKGEASKKKFIESLLVGAPVTKKLILMTDSARDVEEQIRRAIKALQIDDRECESSEFSSGSIIKAKPQQKQRAKVTSKKEKIREEATKKRLEVDVKRREAQATQLIEHAKLMVSKRIAIEKAVAQIAVFVEQPPYDELTFEVHTKLLSFLHKEFSTPSKKQGKLVNILFLSMQKLLRRYAGKEFFAGDLLKKIIRYTCHLGFSDLIADVNLVAESVFSSEATKNAKDKRKRDFKLSKPLIENTESAIVFQLKYFGHHLVRPQGKAVDKRVEFLPDDWQVKLLNVVDAQQSALILAPTSSGKTFISFYCMESVLRLDNTSVVVYIAPTKALVNQVEAEILARFEKKYDHPGTVLTGVFTRDYRKNERNCQILVTVPACLEILMLSMAEPEWPRRIKYIIFDECQTIGALDGDVWEHLFLFTDSPFLALSATINNSIPFFKWLSKVEASRGRKLHYIKYDHRYNNLKPYIFNLASFEIAPIHPCGTLNLRSILENGLPGDMKLLPEHCIALYTLLNNRASDIGIDMTNLDPDRFFKGNKKVWEISTTDMLAYEAVLKEKILSLARSIKLPLFNSILCEISGDAPSAFTAQRHVFAKTRNCLVTHFYNVVQTVKSKDMLPAIAFHFERKGCENLAILLSKRFQSEERETKRKDGTFAKMKELVAQISSEERWYHRVRDLESNMDNKELPEAILSRLENLNAMIDKFNALAATNLQFSCCGTAGTISWEELSQYMRLPIGRLQSNPLCHALRRGIAAHHAGLSTKYRQTVERLFRQQKIRLVIATGTLAVGINMPCKTAIFVGDSPFLNTMNFRQMSGRAGRRGFDMLGHVIFYCVPEDKVKRLITSQLADIQGNMPLTISLALRLLCRYEMWDAANHKEMTQNENKKVVKEATIRILEFPFRAMDNPLLPLVVRHHLRYSLEYLVREGYINTLGEPQDLCGLTNHLYFLEPTNFVFVSLLKAGKFDEYCKGKGGNKKFTLELLVVLANLFCPIQLHRKQRRRHGGPSIVELPKLPKQFKKEIKQHNLRALNTAVDYLRIFTKEYAVELGDANELPLSKIRFLPRTSSNVADSPTVAKFKNYAIKYHVRSPFAALSGKGDTFNSPKELVHSLRSGVFFDVDLIPTLDLKNSRLNAYIYDVYNHKSTKSLLQFNYLRPDILYDNLKNFTLITMTLAAALKKRVPHGGNAAVACEFDKLASEFKAIFEQVQEQ